MGVKLKLLRKRFQNFNIDINLSIEEGKLVTLLGPSGCGKTTTIQLISGIISPDSGSIFINNNDITRLPVWLRNIGIVFQDYALFPHLNVFENIAYGLKARKISKNIIIEKVNEMLELVHLKGYNKRSVDSLSGGEKQRVALARALAPSPELLLLDEPLSALDAKLRTILRREIRRIQKKLGITTIYVTHDQDEALSISDRIILLNSGRVEQEGTPWEIYNKPGTLFSAEFLGESNIIPCTADRILDSGKITFSTADPDLNISLNFGNNIVIGEKYLIFFRPQDTEVIKVKNRNQLTNSISGTIIGTEYFGRYMTVKFKKGGLVINTEIAVGSEMDSLKIKTGENIIVSIDPGKCWIIKE